MKQQITKMFLVFLLGAICFTDVFAGCPVTILPANGSTSGNARCPIGNFRFERGVYLITAAEMAAAGFAPGQVISTIGWDYSTAANISVAGTIGVYFQNTSDVNTTKSTTWSTAITGMTLAHSGAYTLPGSPTTSFDVTLTGTPFTYTGSGIYVAYEWSNPLNALSTGAVVLCTNQPVAAMLNSQQSNVALPTLLAAASNFRPNTRISAAGFANDAAVDIIYTLGSMPNVFTTNHVMQARILNPGNNPQINLNVSLNISGANSFSDNQIIPSIPACGSAMVTFAPFTPSATGTNTVAVSVPSDDNNGNNLKSMSQPVTSNLYSYKYTAPLSGGVGFNPTIFGVFVSKFNTAIPALINEVKVDFQASTAARQFRLAIYNDVGGVPDPTGPVYTSPAVINITAAAQQAFIPITPTVSVTGNYYVGVIQETTNTVNIGFSYQTENPSRTGTFFYANALATASWIDFGLNALPFRSAIEVQLYIPQPPNCAILNAPADLSSACVNGTTLTWASGGGGPTGYRLSFGTNSPTYDNILSNSDLGNVTSYATGALAAGTYGWTVTAYNPDGNSSGCATRTFTTNLAACYCQPTYGSGTGAGDYISLVQIPSTTLNNTTAGAVAPYYTLFPQAGSTTGSLGQGLPYTMNVAGGTFTDCFIRGWIDYNQDGTFSASESIGVSPNVGALTTGAISFSVSGLALTGTTRMRLRSSDTTPGPADSESCANTNSAFGETEDYDITIFATTPCSAAPTPGNTIASANPVCSGVNFTLSLATSYIESGISYVWESSPNGTSWTPVSGGTNATLTTSQTSAMYYHCIVTCAGNGSGTSTDLQVTMSAFSACYCVPVHFGCGNGDITNVTINTLNNTTGCTGAAYASFPASGATTTSVDKGSSYNLSVTTNQPCSTSVWIDWNQSGTFDASEWTLVSLNSTTNVPTVVSIAVPVTALPGLTGMRIRSRLSTFQNEAGDACVAMGSGEGEDYSITINCGGSATSNSPICSNTTLTLFSSPTGATFSWTGPASFTSGAQNPTIPNALIGTNDGPYNVNITSAGCNENIPVNVVINALPTAIPTVSTPFCSGTANLVLTANGSGSLPITYTWNGPALTNDVSVTGISTVSNAPSSASGLYTVSMTDNNSCTSTATINALVYALPPVAVTVIGSNNLCTGQTTSDLQAGGAISYSWSTGATTSLITVSAQGTYTVTGTDGNNCVNTDLAIITESAAPAAPIISPAGSVVLCTDGFTTTSANLSVTNYATNLLWSTSETDQTISINYADIFNVTYTDGNGCYSVSNPVVSSIDMYSTAPTGASSNAPFNNICLGNTVTLSVVGGSLGDNAQWNWYEGGCGSGAVVATGANPTITPLTAGSHTYFVRSESVSCGNTACGSVTITVSPNTPINTVHYTASVNAGCNGSSATFSVNAVAGATFYNWSGTSGALFNGLPGPVQTATPTVLVTFATPPPAGASGYSICAFAGNACVSSNTVCAWVRSKVSQPGVITGSNIACATNNLGYSISPVGGADTYTWTVTGAATINGGTNTLTTASTSVTVNFLGGWTSGSVSVYASLNCGFNSAARSMNISSTPAQPGIMSGPSYVCAAVNPNTYSVSLVSGAVSYNWSCTVPGASLFPSLNSCTIIFPAVIPAGSSVSVVAVSSCGGLSPARTKGIASGAPGTPGNITGPTTGNCNLLGVSYAVSIPSSGATSYLWNITGGATIQLPNNLSGVSIDFPNNFNSGVITVNGVNACGNGGTRTLTVYGAPALPGAITGNAVPCANSVETYSTSGSIGATSYNWTVPSGASILGVPPYGPSITVQLGASNGNVTVSAVNTCGTSGTRSLAVVISCRQSQISEAASGMVNMYPNPTSGKVTLSFNATVSENVVMNISDLLGRNVLSQDIKAEEGANVHEADLTSIAKGVYLVHLKGTTLNEVVKLTVE